MKKLKNIFDVYVRLYIFAIIVIYLIVYFAIINNEDMYMFMDIGADTYCSYWPSIAYVKNLLLDFKLWDASLGIGASTITYISYFLLDPFNWPALFFEAKNIDTGIFIGLTLKIICLSYFAYKYAQKKGFENHTRVIVALTIVFSGWFVGWGQHYNFATVFVFFIALLYYFEVWMQDRKVIGLVLTTAALAIVSPYYCYMSLLFMVFYYFISLYYLYRERSFVIKDFFVEAFQTAGVFILGLGCSAIIFLPYMADTLSSPRVSGSLWPSLELGNDQEYMSIIMRFFSNTILGVNGDFVGYQNFYESPFMYMGILVPILLVLFVLNKYLVKKYWLSIIFVLFAFVFVNFSAPIFNALSTKSYRWTYLFVPVFALACGKVIDAWKDEKPGKRLGFIIVFLNLLMFQYLSWYTENRVEKYGENEEIISAIQLVFLILNLYGIVMSFVSRHDELCKVLLCILAVDMCLSAYVSVHNRSLIAQESKETMNYFDNSTLALDYLKEYDSSFYRVNKKYAHIDLNDSMIQNYNGEKLYSSILPSEMWSMMEFFDLRVKYSNYFYGFDDKQILRNLMSGKYLLSKSDNGYFGYEHIKTVGDVHIYENKYAAEFGVLYDNILVKEDLAEIDEVDLQFSLLDNCIIEGAQYDSILQKFIKGGTTSLDAMEKVLYEGNNINLSEIVVELESENVEPLKIEIGGEYISGTIFAIAQDERVVDSITYSVESNKKSYYLDSLNIKYVKIVSTQGALQNVQVCQLSGDELRNKMDELLVKSRFEVEAYSDEYIKGYTQCDKEQLLFIPIPYNKNWNVLINGEQAKIYNANVGFMAVVVPQGHAEIVIEYVSDVFTMGTYISIASLVMLCGIVVFSKLKKRGIKNEEKSCGNASI